MYIGGQKRACIGGQSVRGGFGVKTYEEEKMSEVAANEEAQRREEYRKMVIQEARKRLIEEHSQKLQGFMPRGKF